MSFNRRDFLRGVAGTSGAVAAGSLLGKDALVQASSSPNPSQSGIEHIVVVMMENRSFDHLLGWFPGATILLSMIQNASEPVCFPFFFICLHRTSGKVVDVRQAPMGRRLLWF